MRLLNRRPWREDGTGMKAISAARTIGQQPRYNIARLMPPSVSTRFARAPSCRQSGHVVTRHTLVSIAKPQNKDKSAREI
jgi:hypothetical protein